MLYCSNDHYMITQCSNDPVGLLCYPYCPPNMQSPVSPVRGGFGGTVGAEVSSVSGESEGEDFGDLKEGLPSGLLPSLLCKQHRVERDFDTLMDQ